MVLAREQQRVEAKEVSDIRPPQETAADAVGGERGKGAASEKAAGEQDEPACGNAFAVLAVAADAGKAGRRNLCGERNALRDVLLGPEHEDGENDERAAGADAEEPRGEAAGKTDNDADRKVMEHFFHTPRLRLRPGTQGRRACAR